MLDNFKDKRILILGFGREGRDTLSFLKKIFPKKKIGIADRKFGKNYLKKIRDHDIVIKSPGIPFKILPKASLSKITSQTEIFFDYCPGKIVGVTGTKGKSTTAFWIYQLLKKKGARAHLVGNVGKPALSSLLKSGKKDIFVYELSSHQLYNLKKSPHVAVLLNIYPEHLDYYDSFTEYSRAKANIARYQKKTDYLIYNFQDPLVRKIAQQSKAKKNPIKGKYYELNRAAVGAVAKIFKAPMLKKFNSLSHRLEYLGKFRGIDFYNDSLSTIPQTTIGALDFLGQKVRTVILGGYDRGLDFKELARKIEKSKVETLILFPSTGKRIKKEIKNRKINCFFVKTMKRAVELAYEKTDEGKICLLSPASASFGLFKNYADRGEQFKRFVKMLK